MHRLVVAAAVAFALSALLVTAGVMRSPPAPRRAAGSLAERGASAALEPLWDAPDFRYVDQSGGEVTRATFAGEVWIANFMFTQCRTVCPLLTARMVELQRRLANVKVRFVSFSVDPARDTPDVLRAYAEHWAPDEARWILVSTDESTLPRLAAGFKIAADKREDPLDPILHTSLFLLVDGAGRVRGAFDSGDAEQLAALEQGIRKLAGAPGEEGPLAPPRTASAVYPAQAPAGADDGVAALEEDPVCHMQVRVGPGAIVAQVGGRTVHFCSEHCRDRYLSARLSAAQPSPISSLR